VTLDARRLRNALGQFSTCVTIIMTVTSGAKHLGIMVSSVNSLSLDPPLTLSGILRWAYSFPAWQQVTHYAVNILSESREDAFQPVHRRQGRQMGWIGHAQRKDRRASAAERRGHL